jgi:hypothetical protein
MLIRWRLGCRLNRTMSPSISCRSTTDPLAVLANEVVDAAAVPSVGVGGRRRTPLDEVLRDLLVVERDLERDREAASDLGRDPDLVDREQRVRTDDRTGREVDPLSREVRTEPSVLPLEALGEGLERTTRAVPGRRDAARLVVEVRRDVVLEQLPEVLDDELGGAHIAVLSQALVDPEHVDQLVGQVVLAPFPALERDGRADLDGGHRKYGEHHPLRASELGVQSERAHVVVGDPLQSGADLLRGDLVAVLAEGRRLVEHDLLLDLVAVGTRPLLLRLPGPGRRRRIVVHRRLGAGARRIRQHASARAARRVEETLDLLRIADVDHRHRELDDPEVPGTLVHASAARPAAQVRLDDPEVEVHQAHLDRIAVVVVRVRRDDLHAAHAPDLVRREERELEALDALRQALRRHRNSYLISSSCSRMITPRLISSSSRSLNE